MICGKPVESLKPGDGACENNLKRRSGAWALYRPIGVAIFGSIIRAAEPGVMDDWPGRSWSGVNKLKDSVDIAGEEYWKIDS